jgi:hypothetical protein
VKEKEWENIILLSVDITLSTGCSKGAFVRYQCTALLLNMGLECPLIALVGQGTNLRPTDPLSFRRPGLYKHFHLTGRHVHPYLTLADSKMSTAQNGHPLTGEFSLTRAYPDADLIRLRPLARPRFALPRVGTKSRS